MVDYAQSLFEQTFPGQPIPQQLDAQRKEALSQHEKLGAEVEAVLNVIEDPNVASALKQDKEKNLEWLQQNYNLTLDQINTLYRYGYFHFSCGSYGEASSYLYHFRILSTDPTLTLSSHWGKLASDILTGEWDRALEEIKLIREQIDAPHRGVYNEQGGAESLLQKRTWLLHWTLFVWFNHPEGKQGLVEMYLSPPYLNTILTSCPWLLRYLVAGLVLTRKTSRVYMVPTPNAANSSTDRMLNAGNPITKVTPAAALRDVSRIIIAEAASYRKSNDPVVDFLAKLYGDFDFEGAQEELKQAEKVAEGDFFLSDHKDGLIEGARYLISEAYTRIHQRVSIEDLSKRLNLSREEGEKWIVNLVRDTRVGNASSALANQDAKAKIDFKAGIVEMSNAFSQTTPPIYQSVIEQTRGFTFRTAAMGQAIDRKAHPQQQQQLQQQQQQQGGNAQRGGRGGGRGGRGGGRGGRGGGAAGAGAGTDNSTQQASSATTTTSTSQQQTQAPTQSTPAASVEA